MPPRPPWTGAHGARWALGTGPAKRYDDGVLIIRNGDGFDLALGEGEVGDLGGLVHFGFRLPAPAAVRMLRERLMADSPDVRA